MALKPIIILKRVYEEPQKTDGFRVLVDRLWPRGISKQAAAIDDWEKDLAPTTELRTWFGHKPERWPEFQKKYKTELEHNEYIAAFVKKHATTKVMTLIYAGKDEAHTHALVLREFLTNLFEHMA